MVLVFLLAVGVLGGAAPRPASAGGPFARLIGVGSSGDSLEITLQRSGARSDASLFSGGPPLAVPSGGYVRLFPLIGGLPGVPGRYYPAAQALCWSWQQPARDCQQADATARRLLAPLRTLRPWQAPPTVLTGLDYRGRRVRPALANLLVALELAFDRRPVRATGSPGTAAFSFVGRWQGPQARLRPRRFTLGPQGVYSGGLLYRLDPGVWAFANANRVPAANTQGLTVRASRKTAQPLYGIVGPAPAGIARIDPTSLRPLPGRRVPLAGHSFGWSFSPDHSRIALGSDTPRAELRLIDLRRMRVLGDVKLAPRGSVFATTWAGPRRLLAVVLNPGCCGLGDTTVAGVDATGRRVLWRRTLGGSLQGGARFRHSLVLLLGPRGRSLGPSRLAIVNAEGRVRSAPLREIQSGSQASGGSDPSSLLVRSWNPGLAVDPVGARAFVVQAGSPIAEVDLRTLQIRYHRLAQPISLLGRLHNWLEPKAEAKAEEGPTRQALWLGHGMLAVTGSDGHAASGPNGGQEWGTPAGLKLIDTRRWSERTLDPKATSATLAASTLLASSLTWDSRTQLYRGDGLTGYTLNGSRRYHRYGNQPISGIQPLGRNVIVGGSAGSSLFRRGALLDARDGRQLRRVAFDITLLVGDQPFWY